MENTMIKGKIAVVFSIVLLLAGSMLSKKALAEEIVVSGNGSDSANEVVSSSSNETNVQSSNDTNINNNVNVEANTGGNSASDNTGGNTKVTTGDVNTNTEIQNSANVSQVAVNNCCSDKGTLTVISGNGTGSNNTVNTSQNNNTNINVTQNTTITNTITGYANTGNNTASGNNGDVFIRTGSISVDSKVKNAPVNLTWIEAALGGNSNNKFKIFGNGSYTDNYLNSHENNNIDITVNNFADIFNNLNFDLNTGNNHADDNNGDVKLITGDIDVETEISNAVNKSHVSVECGCEKPQPTPIPAAPVEKVTTSAPSSSSSPTHEVAGVAMEKVLPVTGANWLFLAFIGNVMMLFLGMILRLRSGNSPGAGTVA